MSYVDGIVVACEGTKLGSARESDPVLATWLKEHGA